WKIYNYQLDYIYQQKIGISDVIADFLPEYKFQRLCRVVTLKEMRQLRKNKLLKWMKFVKGRLKDKFRLLRKKRVIGNRGLIVLSEPLYDLDFLKENLDSYRTLLYKWGQETPEGVASFAKIPEYSWPSDDRRIAEARHNPLGKLFIDNVLHDFEENRKKYIGSLLTIQQVHEREPVSLALWGNPPVYGCKALVFEYLKSRQVPVTGAQHGAGHIDQIVPWSIDSQYNRCTYFLSYGFSDQDRSGSLPDSNITSKTIPVGMAIDKQDRINRRSLDVFFPIANNLSMFDGGMKSIPPGKLGHRQREILDVLAQASELKVCVKPVRMASPRYFAFREYLQDLKSLQVEYNVSVREFLEVYQPKVVLIEYPSTPLYEVLHLDADIFLMMDPLNPFEGQALSELEKRVYIVQDTEDLERHLQQLTLGQLNPKRDHTFYEHYIYKPHREQNILDFIHARMDRSA
ncbi:MAG: hypothetical protein K8I00_08555, partial [Candidatus Omnitrophica bacterium]|nr:hypothetical protein [Candidatus Omnitrophota bacterium]